MSATLESQQIITRLKKEGKTVYNGGLGANPLPPPQILIDTFRENVHLKEYTTPDGIPEVNESVLNHYRSGPYQPTRCLFGNGLKELLFLVQVCFEGLIIHIHPSWVSYQEQTKLLDKKTVSITNMDTQFFASAITTREYVKTIRIPHFEFLINQQIQQYYLFTGIITTNWRDYRSL